MYFYSYEIFFYDRVENENCKVIGLASGNSYEEIISKISTYYENIEQVKMEIISENPMPLCDSSTNTEEDFASVKDVIARIKENVTW